MNKSPETSGAGNPEAHDHVPAGDRPAAKLPAKSALLLGAVLLGNKLFPNLDPNRTLPREGTPDKSVELQHGAPLEPVEHE